MKLKIKKGATVEVIAGSDKGKRGTVVAIAHTERKQLKIKVQGVKVMTHFDRKDGILKKEGFIDYSNVKLVEAAAKAKKESKKSSKAEKSS